ncbi:MAG: carbohydrate binding domain-containing protein [Verrucomicrobiota bacterium]
MKKIINPLPLFIFMFCVFLEGNFSLNAEERGLDIFAGEKWAFYPGYEFPGAKGNRRLGTTEDGKNALFVNYDFAGGGIYVVAGLKMEITEGSKGFWLDVKADRSLKVMIRIEDSSNQTHQYSIDYDMTEGWQTIKIDLTEIRSKGFWGGPKDGVIHFPITKIWLGVEKSKTTRDTEGEVAFSNARIVN